MRFSFRIASPTVRTLTMTLWISVIVVVMIIAIAAVPVAAQDIDAADEALRRGNIAEAKAQYGQIVKGNLADYNALLSYMSTLPFKEALKSADSLSRVQNAPGWAKARALRFSADHLFFKEDYKKAADIYLQASKLDTSSIYKHLHALSMAMDGQAEAARAIWNVIALDKTNDLSNEASRLLVQLPVSTINTVKVDTVKTPLSIPSVPVNPPIAPVNPSPNNTTVSTTTAVKVDTVKTPPAPALPANTITRPNEPLFTVQIGAFASRENAESLVKRLDGKYEDITIASAIGNDQILYKVRVGTFQRREDAIAFADKLIIEAGLSARVTEK